LIRGEAWRAEQLAQPEQIGEAPTTAPTTQPTH
jgi:hypothetical protein